MIARIYSVRPDAVTNQEPAPGWYVGGAFVDVVPKGPFASREAALGWVEDLGDGSWAWEDIPDWEAAK